MNAKTVFISYRRDPVGKAFAGRVFDSLKIRGYDVFLDVENIESGNWKEQIKEEVCKRGHFIFVLTPGSLYPCCEVDDMVRFEFETAISSDRNIVPVKEETKDFYDYKNECPDDIKHLFDKQWLELKHSGFSTGIDELIHKFIPPHKAKSPVNAQTLIIKPPLIVSWFTKTNNYITKNYMPLIDNILTATIILAIGFIVYNFNNTDRWDYISMIPISFTLKLFWNTLSLPREFRMLIQFILIGALMTSLCLLYFIGKVKSKEQTGNLSAIIGLTISTFLSGFGYGVSITTSILRSGKK